MWLSEEGKAFGKSLRTKHLETALQKGKEEYINITYYSLRHFYVTQRWKGGVKLRDIANSCGTVIFQLEKTYYHLDEETLIETALKDDRRGKEKTTAIVQ